MYKLIFLLCASALVGISSIGGLVYRKYIKGIPKCSNCLNLLKNYEIDLMQEKIECKFCGFQSTFYQFSDKIFLHDIFLKILKNKNLDPILSEKTEQLVKKFENFEFSKKK
ncbi:MAG: hypothetical protein KBD53_08260 [Candidatus Omnitrophica bacterium]|nr:hypothetical protein [Candidatus Omnitrophota bacterium]